MKQAKTHLEPRPLDAAAERASSPAAGSAGASPLRPSTAHEASQAAVIERLARSAVKYGFIDASGQSTMTVGRAAGARKPARAAASKTTTAASDQGSENPQAAQDGQAVSEVRPPSEPSPTKASALARRPAQAVENLFGTRRLALSVKESLAEARRGDTQEAAPAPRRRTPVRKTAAAAKRAASEAAAAAASSATLFSSSKKTETSSRPPVAPSAAKKRLAASQAALASSVAVEAAAAAAADAPPDQLKDAESSMAWTRLQDAHEPPADADRPAPSDLEARPDRPAADSA
ncbi:MAG: hypothetical protein LBU12_04890, partial [Deltaproteobacteria bacterium]|nr:hypothetical protein [Deltaproteobacteria bacterium]